VDKEMVEMFLAFTAGMTGMGCLTGVIVTFIRRRTKQPLPPVEVTRRLDEVLERLARLENGVDSTAVGSTANATGLRATAFGNSAVANGDSRDGVTDDTDLISVGDADRRAEQALLREPRKAGHLSVAIE